VAGATSSSRATPRPRNVSEELWRDLGAEAELIEAAWLAALANAAVRRRLVAAAAHAVGRTIALRTGELEIARAQHDEFWHEVDLLTDTSAEVSPALVVAFGARVRLRTLWALHAIRLAIPTEHATQRGAIEATMLKIGPLAPTPSAFADLHAALPRKRKRGRSYGTNALGETKDEVVATIQAAIDATRQKEYALTKIQIARELGSTQKPAENTLNRALKLWTIDLDAMLCSKNPTRRSRRRRRT
jgi:hypothetical protein